MRAFLGRFALALVIVVVLTVAGINEAYRYAASKVAKVSTIKINSSVLERGGNFLFVGSDSRAFVHTAQQAQAFGSPQTQTGQRSDTIMVAHIDPSTGAGYLVSFPRDLWVDIPGMGHSKINAAFNAGPQRVIETIEQNFGVPISHYLEVDFAGFRDLVNALGTVPIYFPTPARDTKTGLAIATAGCHRLNGDQALAYVRSRYYQSLVNGQWQYDPTSDLGRIQRQQYFLRTLSQQAVHAAEHAPWRAPDILDKMLASLQRDQKLGLSGLRALAYAFSGNAGPLTTVTLPTTPQVIDGQDALVLDSTKAAPMFARLRGEDDGHHQSAPANVAPSSVRVAVENGGGVNGQGHTALAALQARGFHVVSPATDADRSDYVVSEVRYAPSADNKARLVLAQLGGAGKLVALSARPNNGADVVLVIGRDFGGISAPTTAAAPHASATAPKRSVPHSAPTAGC
jgi:LCP family protein required for cell wall assembly